MGVCMNTFIKHFNSWFIKLTRCKSEKKNTADSRSIKCIYNMWMLNCTPLKILKSIMSKKSFVYIPAKVQNKKNVNSRHNNSCQSAYNFLYNNLFCLIFFYGLCIKILFDFCRLNTLNNFFYVSIIKYIFYDLPDFYVLHVSYIPLHTHKHWCPKSHCMLKFW